MSKKIKDPTIIKTLSVQDIDRLSQEIENFRNGGGDDLWLEYESILVEIYSDGNIKIKGDFKSTQEVDSMV